MGIERNHVIGAGICAVLSWLLITAALPSLRWIPYAFVAGFLVALLSIVYLLVASCRPSQHGARRVVLRPVPTFVMASNWDGQKADVNLRSQYIRRRLFESQLQLSLRIDGLLDLITDNFITAWFVNISAKRLFQNEVDRAIRDAIASIQIRVQDLDMIEIAVSRIVPIITAHMQEFYTAERLVRGKNLTRDMTESEELDLAIAGKYNDGKLHQAASLAFADTKLMQQAHVRKNIEKILPLVLSEDMLSSPAVLALVREIVSCAVLAPILLILADPDMWHQIIENYGKSVLQDRKNVRKLRAALDEHAPASPRGRKTIEIPRLKPHDNERQFERFIRNLRKIPNLAEARRYRSEIISQIRKGVDSNNQDPLYLRRLEAGKRILDQKIASLASLDASIQRPNLATQPSTVSIDSANGSSQATLKEILHNATALSYFMEFMDRRQRMRLVQFWIIVDGFRDPLEGDTDEAEVTLHEKMTFESSDRMNIKQLRDAYLQLPELHVPSSSKEAVDAYVNAGKTADLMSYVKARRAILRAQTAVYDEMKEEHLESFKRSDLFYKWSASENQIQSPVIQENDGQWQSSPRPSKPERVPSQRPVSVNVSGMRKEPELRRAVMSSTDLQSKAKQSLAANLGRRSIDDNASRPLFDDDVEDERMTRSVPSLGAGESDTDSIDQNQDSSSQVVDAMQKELDEIMEQPDKDWALADAKTKSNNSSDSPRFAEELFRSPGDSHVRPSIASLGLVTGSSSRGVFTDDLFGHEEEKFLEDEKDDPEMKPIEDDIHEAAPGDLGLTEAISVLGNDIERLVAQEKIVESLTKKAELTNNAAELRILRKSKHSLQREIRRKEMQKQQYVVQESDNSLYGRAAVSIKSIMVGKEEDGHEFAIYVIEVRKQAGDQMPAATWTVTRRYSEFHELHKRLRSRFESVRNLEFPRRQTLFTLQKDFLQRRRIVLERYLRSLLLIPAICRSRDLRSFLSQSAIVPTDGSQTANQADLVTRIYNSVSDGMEEFLGNLPMLDQLTVAGQNLISAASAQISGAPPPPVLSSSTDAVVLPDAEEAEAELAAYDEAAEQQPFVKPISDLFLETFELQKGSAWLRGRAVVVVLHQLLGGTVERKIREAARGATAEEQLVKYVDMVRDMLFPGGKLKAAGAPRTGAEKARSRKEAGEVLGGLVPDLAGSVVGRGNARAASRKVAGLVGNGRLNTHLVMRLFDEVVAVVFPEVAGK
ncbi:intermediate filament protein-like protein [Myriangium duriaei CBS 260.36]|uniref:Intermediate filament protein-like protein n=1 Tax=Myriangium duriaei CBS 260.36 TaxID=1168546 RepID=A0A9P4MMN7_9PEZI|nr:intermediate filament protein-like protein [Myriangium duriaei CBS 260.36]